MAEVTHGGAAGGDGQRRSRLLTLCFVVSGGAGLTYEVVWARALGAVFGSTSLAVSTVLAVYFGGLAIGGWLFGRYADRTPRDLLRVYAVMELLVGLFGGVSLWLISATLPLYGAVAERYGFDAATLHLMRVVIAALLLAPPTLLMGGTVPVVMRYVVNAGARVAKGAGVLYAANTFGAVAGAAFAGFYLLPNAGMGGTVAVAVGLNLLVAVVAWFGGGGSQVEARSDEPTPAREPLSIDARSGLAVAGMSGFAALGYEVLWSRMLGIHFFTTTYALTLVLTAFLTGIGLGSLAGGRYVEAADKIGAGRNKALVGLGFAQALIGLWAIAVNNVYLLPLSEIATGSFVVRMLIRGALNFALLLPPACMMGATFPLAARLFAARAEGEAEGSVGQRLGGLYALNTVGGILGSLGAGFFLIPLLGLIGSVALFAAVNLAAATVALRIARVRSLARYGAGALVAGAVVLAVAAQSVWPAGITPLKPGDELLHYRDGPGASVAVLDRPSPGQEESKNRVMIINGKRQATASLGRWMIRRLAHLPLLLHPEPERTLMLGFGGGITTGAASLHPRNDVDAVEILEEAVEAAPFFADDNHGVLERENVRLLVGDGRNVLRLTKRRYDAIISDLYFPWEAGVGYLYSVDHYRRAADRLEDGGIYCQWVSLFQMSEPDLKSLVRSFLEAFPGASLWFTHREAAFVALVGRKDGQPLEVDAGSILKRLRDTPALAEDLRGAGIDEPIELLQLYATGPDALKAWSGDAALNTDAFPRLEFTVPQNQGMSRVARHAFLSSVMKLWAEGDGVQVRESAGVGELISGLSRAREAAGLVAWSQVHMILGDHANRARYLKRALDLRSDEDTEAALRQEIVFLRRVGERYLAARRPKDAKRIYEALIEVDGDKPEYREALGGG